jgi:hypothetical protein
MRLDATVRTGSPVLDQRERTAVEDVFAASRISQALAQRGGSGAYCPARLRQEVARGRIPLARAARACRRRKRAPPVAGFDGLSTVAPLQIPECEVTPRDILKIGHE